jgi:hypothetical protein
MKIGMAMSRVSLPDEVLVAMRETQKERVARRPQVKEIRPARDGRAGEGA